MKKLLGVLLCALFLMLSPLQAKEGFSPFGVPGGLKIPTDTTQALLFLNKHGMNGVNYGTSIMLTTVPKPIPQATFYYAVHTEKTGICQVQAVIDSENDIKTLQDTLIKKYGEPKLIDLKVEGGFASRVWVSNIHQLPKNIMSIEISPREGTYGVIPILAYSFNNFRECQKAIEENVDDAL